MAEVKWIKIPSNFFGEERIKTLEKQQEADSLISFYLHLLCKSSKKGKGRPVFTIAKNVEITNEMLAAVFRKDVSFISKALNLFEQLRLITRNKYSLDIHKAWNRNRASKAYSEWRGLVFLRDKYTCQCCGQKGGFLNAHHIKKWSEHPSLRFDIDNGITVCQSCHKKIHKGES